MNTNISNDLIIAVNKPIGWTSFDVVAFSRKKLGIKKIGHCGTLDPLATGLLLLATNKATKQIESLQILSKTYTATFCLGATTDTIDTEFWPLDFQDTSHISSKQIQAVISKNFLGKFMQIPPQYSAVSIKGKKAYKFARQGVDIVIPEREVRIYEFKINNLKIILPTDLPYQASSLAHYKRNPNLLVEQIVLENQKSVRMITFEAQITCSKGTYIRSLISDLARELGTIGYMLALKRTAIGNYLLSDAIDCTDIGLLDLVVKN